MGYHGKCTLEFKQRAVELHNPRKTAYAEVARELGADDGTLAKWVRLANNERRGPWWPICPPWRLCSRAVLVVACVPLAMRLFRRHQVA